MKARTTPAGAQGTAGTAELRNAEGKKGVRNCGRTAEKLRKTSSLSSSLPCANAPQPALELARRGATRRPTPGALTPSDFSREWHAAIPATTGRAIDLAPHEDAVIAAALAILGARLRITGSSVVYDSPGTARQFMRLHLAGRRREVFAALFLDNQHRAIAFEVMFEGTLTCTSVYPRELVRRALELDAAAVILTHNHPSGSAEPSRADKFLTQSLRSTLSLVDCRVIDHIVVGDADTVSLAERGLI